MLLGRETFAAAGVLLICNGPYNDSIKFFSKKRDVVSDVRSMFTENFAEIYRNAYLERQIKSSISNGRTRVKFSSIRFQD